MIIYNSLTRKKETFIPVEKGIVKMYSCGPTVYSYAHIGNMRAYVFMDLLRKTIKYNGFELNSVMNITNVGHLTSDADEGDDKMEVTAKKEGKSVYEIAQFYTDFFFDQIDKLNIEKPEHICRATDYIEDMIDFVKVLVEKGFAYENSKGIYFDISKFKDYGELSKVKLEDKLAGARIEVDEEKRNPQDFALWIKASPDHIMQWESPWGMGYPGWHIECSAMGNKVLGEHIDIHTGGVDHLTIHHENEIAQSNCYCGHRVVNYWMHCEFLMVDGGKMGKSLGNCYLIDDLIKKGYSPLAFRYFCMNTHYRKAINFTFDAMNASQSAFDRLKSLVNKSKYATEISDKNIFVKYKKDFLDAINDDLNIPKALGVVWTMIDSENPSKTLYETIIDFDKVLGLRLDQCEEEKIEIPKEIKKIAEERKIAKINKNYLLSDELRNKINNLGFDIKDKPNNDFEIFKK